MKDVIAALEALAKQAGNRSLVEAGRAQGIRDAIVLLRNENVEAAPATVEKD